MTRKDYVLIAQIIAEMGPWDTDKWSVAEAFAKRLDATYPNFNRERFIAAATGEK